MSLQLAAQHLSSQGRGKDSTLVHMSPREVKSLNDLAMAHGGQLSINPNTGLPEAGFLEMILPIAIGAMAGPGGMALGAETALGSAGTAALIGGGVTYAMTGSLQKGLMAGLGAYGGANIGGALGETAVTMDPNVVAAQNEVVKNAVANQYNPANTSLTPDAWSSSLPENYASTQQATNKALADELVKARSAVTPAPGDFMGGIKNMFKGAGSLGQEGGLSSLYQNMGGSPMSLLKTVGSAAAPAIGELMKPKKEEETKADADMGQRYGFAMNPTGGQQTQQAQPGQNPLSNTPTPTTTPFPQPDPYGREQRYFSPSYTKFTPEQAKAMYGYADGGIAEEDRPTETPAVKMFQQMQAQRAAQAQAPQVDINAQYANYLKQTVGSPPQMPTAPTLPAPTTTNLASSGYAYDPVKQQYGQIQGSLEDEEEEKKKSSFVNTGSNINANSSRMARGSLFSGGGGISHLGDYSDGGRLLRGPGDGVSDSIPAMIGKRQPARLADGEFVVPARIVSELGNGSTEAGARKLYAMMDRIQSARGKTVGKGKVAKNSRSEKYLPA